jgi:hypothetical protein
MTEPDVSIRSLMNQAEFTDFAALRREIWGLPESVIMSTITLRAPVRDKLDGSPIVSIYWYAGPVPGVHKIAAVYPYIL